MTESASLLPSEVARLVLGKQALLKFLFVLSCRAKDPYTGSIIMHVGSSCKHTGVYNVHLQRIIRNRLMGVTGKSNTKSSNAPHRIGQIRLSEKMAMTSSIKLPVNSRVQSQ